ncbi:NAD-dependent epimerase/dehydratase family protein, partial [Oceanicola sp. S124]|uniref:NAD-dependent epimerase/dehydratase family protein n=1 Tax=Oceanicola sp. S124 TaxID=1042378 RepID=UPI0002558D96
MGAQVGNGDVIRPLSNPVCRQGPLAEMHDAASLHAAMQGCDAVIHLGGYSIEGPFAPIMEANILGLYNLYEAARANGQPRILFASSNHVVGFHAQSDVIDASAMPRPDSLYGVSKVFG